MSEFTLTIIILILEFVLMVGLIISHFVASDSKWKTDIDIMFVLDLIALVVTYLTLSIPSPEIYPSDGQISEGGSVRISAKGVGIYYTLDANLDPREDGVKYKEPFKLEQSVTINVKTNFLSKWSECVTLGLEVDENGDVKGVDIEKPGISIESISASWNREKLYSGTVLTTKDIKVEGKTIKGDIVSIKDFTFFPNVVEEGDNIFTIIYKNLETTLEGIAVVPQLTQLYAEFIGDEIWEGDRYEKEQFKVIGKYEDGTEGQVEDYTISPKHARKVGSNTVLISKDRIKTEVAVEVLEAESPFVAASELHNPNGAYDPQVTVTPWKEKEDYTIDGKTFSNGLKLKFEYLISSLWGNDYSAMSRTESKLYVAVNQEVLQRKAENERYFDGYIVVGSETNGSVTTAEVLIYADDKLIYESGEITSASTNIPEFHIPADGVNQIIFQTNAKVCGRPFYLGIVTK